jgi:hypothetical protein
VVVVDVSQHPLQPETPRLFNLPSDTTFEYNSDPNDVQFKPGSNFPVAFAVWDGSNVERNGMKGISTWFTAQMPN